MMKGEGGDILGHLPSWGSYPGGNTLLHRKQHKQGHEVAVIKGTFSENITISANEHIDEDRLILKEESNVASTAKRPENTPINLK